MSAANIVTQLVKPPIVMPAVHVRALVRVLAVLVSNPANVPGEAGEDGPGT